MHILQAIFTYETYHALIHTGAWDGFDVWDASTGRTEVRKFAMHRVIEDYRGIYKVLVQPLILL